LVFTSSHGAIWLIETPGTRVWAQTTRFSSSNPTRRFRRLVSNLIDNIHHPMMNTIPRYPESAERSARTVTFLAEP
jgi:hypothetical protein